MCINQSDDIEKGVQVQIMGEIYKTAKRTIIWLGESDEHVAHVQELMRALSGADSASGEAAASDDIAVLQHMIGIGNSQSEDCTRRLKAITSFLNRDWFTRVWVFQEAVLSKALIIRCGGAECQFGLLKRIADAVCDIQYGVEGYARSLVSTTVGLDTLDLIQHSRKECTRADCMMSGSENFLGLLLKVLLQCKATNERDLIYAFLAFQDPKEQEVIKPNYSLTIENVWTDAAVYIIKSSRSLDLFCAASGGQRKDLPSWVPDWSKCYSFGRPFAAPDMQSAFCSGGGTQHYWQEPKSATQLLVRGKIIDHIDWFSPWNFETVYYKDVSLQDFLSIDKHVESLRRYLYNQHGMSADSIKSKWLDLDMDILRTLLADGAFGNEQPLSSIADIMATYRKSGDGEHAENAGEPHGEIAGKLHELVLILQKKRFFVSEELRLGLAPEDVHRNGAKVGDAIAILEGSRTPCLLRPLEGNCYQVVSQCYLDQWMYKVPPDGKSVETFVLV